MTGRSVFLPGARIGMMGGGQLGRMSILAGRHMGYPFTVFDPDPHAPAGSVADAHTSEPFEWSRGHELAISSVDVATLEFENIPLGFYEEVSRFVPVCPDPEVLAICQDRLKEKRFLDRFGFPHARFAPIMSRDDLDTALAEMPGETVLKTARSGYDGKGQWRLGTTDSSLPGTIWMAAGNQICVLEEWVDHQGEFSVICARNGRGETTVFPPFENDHRRHILHLTTWPARIERSLAAEAEELGIAIADAIGLVGILTVELFLVGGRWLVNELAPRPHNSGHLTIDACETSQFEQHVRAVCGLPLGRPARRTPAVMVNLLGDLWSSGEPDWARLMATPGLKLHLYGKREARAGRKMGHFTILGEDTELLRRQAGDLFRYLDEQAQS